MQVMLTKREEKRLRSILQKEKKRIEKQLKKLGPADFGTDLDIDEDAANEVEQRWDDQAVADVLMERLKGIDAALEKMEKGTYGICENCGKEIAIELLNIDPESRLCQRCKREHG